MTFPARPIPEGAILIPENATLAFKGEIFDVYQWPQEQFDGSIKTFEMIKRPDTVLIIPVNDDGKLWVIKEEQPGRGIRGMRLPGGRVDVPGKTVFEAAKRECEEEIGVRFKEWYYLESIQPERKIDWLIHIFLAKMPTETVPTRHEVGEKIEIFQASYEEFLKRGLSSKRIQVFEECATLDELFLKAQPLDERILGTEFVI